jgi:hypothetical protein
MELILAILGAGPIGYFTETRRKGLLIYLAAWAVVFPVQCIVVNGNGDLDASYWPINALILAVGIGLNRFGSIQREKREKKQRTKTASLPV